MSGNISAQSLEEARAKLSASGLSILSLKESQEEGQPKEGIQLYEFQALSPDHKTVGGTIEAADEYAAFKKLKTEYQLELNYLVLSTLPLEEKQKKKETAIDPALEQRLEEELKLQEKKEDKKKKNVVDETKQILEEQKKEMEFMQEKVGEIIMQVQALIKKGGRFLKPEKKRLIEEKLDLLARLRRSNSIDHLKSLLLKTIEELVGGTVFLEEKEVLEEERPAWLATKAEFQAFGMGFEKGVNEGLTKIKSLFANIEIDPEKLKYIADEVKKANPVKKFFTTTFYTFASLFVLCFVFWGWVLIGVEESRASFYFHSGALWYTTITSLILALFLGAGLYAPQIDNKIKRAGLAGAALLVWLSITFEFYLIFFWI